MPLDAAAQQTAKLYLASLGQGRQATAAKDFAAADAAFSKCVELVPGDARALSERGYARLLAERLPEADADLQAAEKNAPNVALKLQVLHNRMLVAKKQGQDGSAAYYADQRQKLKAAKQLGKGVSCNANDSASDVVPERPASLDAAFELAFAAHAKLDKVDVSSVGWGTRWGSPETSPEQLKQLAAKGPLADDWWVLLTSANELANHLLVAHGGQLYLFPVLSSGNVALCGAEGLAELTLGGGVKEPWHITRSVSQAVRGYLCTTPDGKAGPCSGGSDEVPGMGFCSWSFSRRDLILLDAKTLKGLGEFTVTAEPSGDSSPGEPEHLLDFEWQAEQVSINACGEQHRLAYAR